MENMQSPQVVQKDSGSVIAAVVLVFIALAVVTAVPRLRPHWGVFSMMPTETVTVSGVAQSRESNQIATFTAGVTATDPMKEKATEMVNTEVEKLLASLEQFGIAKEDVKTQNLSIYKLDDGMYQANPVNKEVKWQANNSIEITLRDIDKTSDLTDLLAKSGATNVYGPQFMLDQSNKAEDELIGDAIQNAREKAEKIAQGSGRKLGQVVNVVEGGSSGGIYPMMDSARSMGGGGGAPVEPGTTGVSKSVTVTFSLK